MKERNKAKRFPHTTPTTAYPGILTDWMMAGVADAIRERQHPENSLCSLSFVRTF